MHWSALYWIVFLFLPLRKWQDGIGGIGNVSFLKCLVIGNIVTAWFIYIRLLNACLVVFFSLWEISDGVCVILLPARACVSVCARIKECASPQLWITSVYALHVFVLCGRLGVSVALMCLFYLCARVCARVCVCVALAQLSVSERSCGVLVRADAWPVEERVWPWELAMLGSLPQRDVAQRTRHGLFH